MELPQILINPSLVQVVEKRAVLRPSGMLADANGKHHARWIATFAAVHLGQQFQDIENTRL